MGNAIDLELENIIVSQLKGTELYDSDFIKNSILIFYRITIVLK